MWWANLLEVVEAAGADVAVALVDEVLFAPTLSVRVVAARVAASHSPSRPAVAALTMRV